MYSPVLFLMIRPGMVVYTGNVQYRGGAQVQLGALTKQAGWACNRGEQGSRTCAAETTLGVSKLGSWVSAETPRFETAVVLAATDGVLMQLSNDSAGSKDL